MRAGLCLTHTIFPLLSTQSGTQWGWSRCLMSKWRDPPRPTQSPSPDYWCQHRDSTFHPCPCSPWLGTTACCFHSQCIQRSHCFCRWRGRCRVCWKNFPHTLKMIMKMLLVRRRWEGLLSITHHLWVMLCVMKGNNILNTPKQLLGDVIISKDKWEPKPLTPAQFTVYINKPLLFHGLHQHNSINLGNSFLGR